MKSDPLARIATLRGPVLLVALASAAGAQDQTWIQQFGTSTLDFAQSAVPDDAGGVFVCGATLGNLGGTNAGSHDAWLARYDGAGNQAWIRQFGTSALDWALAAALDGAGGVFVSGYTSGSLGGPNAGDNDAWLAHFDGGGNQTWTRQLGTIGDDRVTAAAPDGVGGVFVGGTTTRGLAGPHVGLDDAWLAHYDGSGNQTWIRQWGSNGQDRTTTAVSDGADGVIVGGHTTGSLAAPNEGLNDAWLAHFDGAGNQTWIRQVGLFGDDRLNAAASDGAGGVYVSGHTNSNLGGPLLGMVDAWLARFDGVGNQTWMRQFGTFDIDDVHAAAPDGAGGVFLSGNTYGSLGGQTAGGADVWLTHYDAAGNQRWIQQFGSPGTSNYPRAIAPDGAGGVFLGGSTNGSLGGPHAGSYDAWLALYEGPVATRYCTPAVVNSTGQPATQSAIGSNEVSDNDLTLVATQLPLNTFGFFLRSRTPDLVVGAGGSQGTLCLGGSIYRYSGPGQIKSSGSTGTFSLWIDLTQMTPTPFGYLPAQPGEIWNFQAWYRDANPTSTTNFTDAVSVLFR